MTLFKKAFIPTYTINWLTALLNPVIYILCNPTFRYDTQVLVLKITKKYTQNMILMSRYKGQLHGGKGPNIWSRPSPPPAQRKTIFGRRCSLLKSSQRILGGVNLTLSREIRKSKRVFNNAFRASGLQRG